MKDRTIDWGERLVLLLLFVLFVTANIRSNDLVNLLLIAVEGLTMYFVLTRRTAISVSQNPADWALALVGTTFPMLARPGGEALVGWPVTVLMAAGLFIAVSAKLSLNRRFGIAPANRGVQDSLAYAFVRHPMYLGYMVAQAGYLLHNPTRWNLAIYVMAWALQIGRIWREERHLMADPAYQVYAARVRYRLAPGLF